MASTSPSDATTPVAAPTIAVTFTAAMNPATLTGQTTAGACSGSVQVSLDGFASCVAFSSASASMSGGNTTATFAAAPGLLVKNRDLPDPRDDGRAERRRPSRSRRQFTQPGGFTTTSPNLCDGSIVISQIYGGGGNAGAVYKNDFIELHNRGTTTVSLDRGCPRPVRERDGLRHRLVQDALPSRERQHPAGRVLPRPLESGSAQLPGTFLTLPTPGRHPGEPDQHGRGRGQGRADQQRRDSEP